MIVGFDAFLLWTIGVWCAGMFCERAFFERALRRKRDRSL